VEGEKKGWAHIEFVLAGRYARFGFEVNPVVFFGRLLSLGKKKVSIKWGSFWSKDLSHADIIFCYLFPDVLERLAVNLKKELKPGARVVSCNFPLPGWLPQEILRPDESRNQDPIYIYSVPPVFAKVGEN
jgi:hypothetical protein